MNKKLPYTTPTIEIIHFTSEEYIANFIITSKAVGEDEGYTKRHEIELEDEDMESDNNTWKDVSY